MSKIVGTLGPKSRSVDVISGCLKGGMSVAEIDLSWGEAEYHQETSENLKAGVKSTKKLCAVMLGRVGPELQVIDKSEKSDQNQEAFSEVLPINFDGLSMADFALCPCLVFDEQ